MHCVNTARLVVRLLVATLLLLLLLLLLCCCSCSVCCRLDLLVACVQRSFSCRRAGSHTPLFRSWSCCYTMEELSKHIQSLYAWCEHRTGLVAVAVLVFTLLAAQPRLRRRLHAWRGPAVWFGVLGAIVHAVSASVICSCAIVHSAFLQNLFSYCAQAHHCDDTCCDLQVQHDPSKPAISLLDRWSALLPVQARLALGNILGVLIPLSALLWLR
jgi:hypothetical protein